MLETLSPTARAIDEARKLQLTPGTVSDLCTVSVGLNNLVHKGEKIPVSLHTEWQSLLDRLKTS